MQRVCGAGRPTKPSTSTPRSGSATVIPGLVADPLLIGGGLHRMAGDGKLGMHVDFSELMIGGHRYYRRLNLLLFLNPIWETLYGGALELSDHDFHREP